MGYFFVTVTFPCLPKSEILSRSSICLGLISVLVMAYRRQLSCHSMSSGYSMASAASLMSSHKPSLLTLTNSLSLLEKSPSASASSFRSVFNTCSSFGSCGVEFEVAFGFGSLLACQARCSLPTTFTSSK